MAQLDTSGPAGVAKPAATMSPLPAAPGSPNARICTASLSISTDPLIAHQSATCAGAVSESTTLGDRPQRLMCKSARAAGIRDAMARDRACPPLAQAEPPAVSGDTDVPHRGKGVRPAVSSDFVNCGLDWLTDHAGPLLPSAAHSPR